MSLANDIIYGDSKDILPWLESDVDLNGIDEYGFTPLIETVIAQKTEIAKLLLNHGVRVDVPDVTGRTALYWAVDNQDLPLCELFLKYKADPNAYTRASEPILVNPLLRGHTQLKELLYHHGADLNFAQDYINTKLVGHRFELSGEVDIVNHKGQFIELDYEGFFLEFTLGLIQNSLARFQNNFAARRLRAYFPYVEKVIHALAVAAELIKFQQYTMDVNKHQDKISKLLDTTPLVIPMGYEGHAITFIHYGNFLAKCDRGELSHQYGSVVVYQITHPRVFTKEFIREMLYKKQNKAFVEKGIHQQLGLKPITQLPLPSQIVGNCSWANVEAVLPTTLFIQFMLLRRPKTQDDMIHCKEQALEFYKQWREWDKDIALQGCIQSFQSANRIRKASKAAILGAVLFQTCDYRNSKHIARAEKILPILTMPEYSYVLRNYIDVYYRQSPTPEGTNLMHLIDIAGFTLD